MMNWVREKFRGLLSSRLFLLGLVAVFFAVFTCEYLCALRVVSETIRTRVENGRRYVTRIREYDDGSRVVTRDVHGNINDGAVADAVDVDNDQIREGNFLEDLLENLENTENDIGGFFNNFFGNFSNFNFFVFEHLEPEDDRPDVKVKKVYINISKNEKLKEKYEKHFGKDKNCAICLEDTQLKRYEAQNKKDAEKKMKKEAPTLLICNHVFHRNCIVNALLTIERNRQEIKHLSITPTVLAELRKTAKLQSTHFSTMIEGNRLTQQEVQQVIEGVKLSPEKQHDVAEILGYYAALDFVEKKAQNKIKISEKIIQEIHALVMGNGKKQVKPTPYRKSQNVIKESRTGRIVYLPPEAKDVKPLMNTLVDWLNSPQQKDLASPLKAGIAHYQFATIHPYFDGNGRTARLLTTLILHLGHYDLKGICNLDQYYAMNLGNYYDAIAIGSSHNYYMGRAEADITPWLEYFCTGMAESFAAVKQQAQLATKSGSTDQAALMRSLDSRQRRALALFEKHNLITSNDIAKLFNLSQRTARNICKAWVDNGFLTIADQAKKSRKYTLAEQWHTML